MKRFRIKEEYIHTVWTYIKANSLEEATTMLENNDCCGVDEEISSEHKETFWDTLEEVEGWAK